MVSHDLAINVPWVGSVLCRSCTSSHCDDRREALGTLNGIAFALRKSAVISPFPLYYCCEGVVPSW